MTTKSQLRALEWLPGDGSWKMKPKGVAQALGSLLLCDPHLVEQEAGNFGPRGSWQWRYRLTKAGIKARAEHVGASYQ